MERSVKYLGSNREEAKQRYVVQCSKRYGRNHAAVLWLCVHYNLSEDTTKLLKFLIGLSQVSDGLIGMVRILRLKTRRCDESSVACDDTRWFFGRNRVLEA